VVLLQGGVRLLPSSPLSEFAIYDHLLVGDDFEKGSSQLVAVLPSGNILPSGIHGQGGPFSNPFLLCFPKTKALSTLGPRQVSRTDCFQQNAAAQSIKCKICFSTFQSTAARKNLDEHASNKHNKKYEDCFA
jgi:hypothetical protein